MSLKCEIEHWKSDIGDVSLKMGDHIGDVSLK